jgi:CRISPR/Cas system-associated exonuclease Cas4 (RecB family)
MLNKLYIGSNNQTHKLEIDKIKKTLNLYFEGATIYEAKGFWKGNEEKTAIVEIETEENEKIKELIDELKKTLRQEAIG